MEKHDALINEFTQLIDYLNYQKDELLYQDKILNIITLMDELINSENKN